MQKQAINNILAISSTGIGNLVLYTPVLKALRRDFPESSITLIVGSSTAAALLDGSKEVDEIIVLDKKKNQPYHWHKFIRNIQKQIFFMISYPVGLGVTKWKGGK